MPCYSLEENRKSFLIVCIFSFILGRRTKSSPSGKFLLIIIDFSLGLKHHPHSRDLCISLSIYVQARNFYTNKNIGAGSTKKIFSKSFY